jgi:hypothetical protein
MPPPFEAHIARFLGSKPSLKRLEECAEKTATNLYKRKDLIYKLYLKLIVFVAYASRLCRRLPPVMLLVLNHIGLLLQDQLLMIF